MRSEGLEPEFEAPIEERSFGDVVVNVTIWVAEQGAAALVGGAVTAAVLRAKVKVKEKLPRAKIEVDQSSERSN